MKIWVVNEGEHIPPLTGKGRLMRGGMLAHYFSENEDNEVTWIFSDFLHYEKKFYANKFFEKDLKKNLHLKMLHTRHAYKKNISLARIRYCRLLGRELKQEMERLEKPDVIYCSWPIIEEAYECVRYGQENGVPVVIDIRDMWPDIFIQPFHGVVRKMAGCAVNRLYGEKTRYVMQKADKVIGVVPAMVQMAGKYGRKMKESDHPVFLAYRKNAELQNPESGQEEIRRTFGLRISDFLVSYFGTVNNRVDNMDILIDAAEKNTNRDVKFIICGQGMAYEECKKRTGNLNNIIFTGLLDKTELAAVAGCSKLGLLAYRNSSDFTDALPNKFGEYLSYKLPVLTSLAGLSRQVVERENCGMYFDSAESLNEIIEKYYSDEKFLEAQSQSAWHLYQKQFDADTVYRKLLSEIEELV